jgi:hypothetical protein
MLRPVACARAGAQLGRKAAGFVCSSVRPMLHRRAAHAHARVRARAVAALLVFFMTSEMTEKFLTIAPTNTLRKMNAMPSGGPSVGERACGREHSPHGRETNKHTDTLTLGRAGSPMTAPVRLSTDGVCEYQRHRTAHSYFSAQMIRDERREIIRTSRANALLSARRSACVYRAGACVRACARKCVCACVSVCV